MPFYGGLRESSFKNRKHASTFRARKESREKRRTIRLRGYGSYVRRTRMRVRVRARVRARSHILATTLKLRQEILRFHHFTILRFNDLTKYNYP